MINLNLLFFSFLYSSNFLSPIIPGLWLRITMLLEHKIHFILGTLLFLENAIVMLYSAAVFIFVS